MKGISNRARQGHPPKRRRTLSDLRSATRIRRHLVARSFLRGLRGLMVTKQTSTEWREHLVLLKEDGTLSKEVLRTVERITRVLVPSLGPPRAGGLSGYTLVRDRGDHHLSIEVRDDGSLEWFYRNRETGYVSGSDDFDGVDYDLNLLFLDLLVDAG